MADLKSKLETPRVDPTKVEPLNPPTSEAEILLRAADIIERHGLCQDGRACGDEGEVCVLIAMSRTWRGKRNFDEERLFWSAVERLEIYLGLDPARIIDWTANICRNKAQAVAALRGAAHG